MPGRSWSRWTEPRRAPGARARGGQRRPGSACAAPGARRAEGRAALGARGQGHPGPRPGRLRLRRALRLDPGCTAPDQSSPVGPVGRWLGWASFSGLRLRRLPLPGSPRALRRGRLRPRRAGRTAGPARRAGLVLLLVSATGILARVSDTLGRVSNPQGRRGRLGGGRGARGHGRHGGNVDHPGLPCPGGGCSSSRAGSLAALVPDAACDCRVAPARRPDGQGRGPEAAGAGRGRRGPAAAAGPREPDRAAAVRGEGASQAQVGA